MDKVDLFNNYAPKKRTKYIVSAGKNKNDRQMYIAEYIDSDIIDYTAVPCILGKTKATELLIKANRKLKEWKVKNPRRFPKDLTLELKEWDEATQSVLEN